MSGDKVSNKDIALVVASAISAASGCYAVHAPYATMEITSPRARHTEVYVSAQEPVTVFIPVQPQVVYPGRPVVVPSYEVPVFVEECQEFAASAADSMNPNGRRIGVCTGVNANPYARREWSQPFPTRVEMHDFPYNP